MPAPETNAHPRDRAGARSSAPQVPLADDAVSGQLPRPDEGATGHSGGAPSPAGQGRDGSGPDDHARARAVLDRWRSTLLTPVSGGVIRRGAALVATWHERARQRLAPGSPSGSTDATSDGQDRARPQLIALVALAALAVLAGVIVSVLMNRGSERRGSPATVDEASPAGSSIVAADDRQGSLTGISSSPRATGTTRPEVIVHAAGAVMRPGVYRLPGGSRVADLIDAAGGLGPMADGDRVNLAAPLVDGGRLYVPHKDEATPPTVVSPDAPSAAALAPGAQPGGGSGTSSSPGPVNINTASATELDTLPGVGPATSAAIIDYRNQHGQFKTVDDLTKVRGIGKAKLDQLRPLVTT